MLGLNNHSNAIYRQELLTYRALRNVWDSRGGTEGGREKLMIHDGGIRVCVLTLFTLKERGGEVHLCRLSLAGRITNRNEEDLECVAKRFERL